MEEQLLDLLVEFEKDIRTWNLTKKSSLDDEELPTLENFIKWLKFRWKEKPLE